MVLLDPDGERSFLTDRAAAAELARRGRRPVLDGAAVLHLPAYSLVDGPIAPAAHGLAAAAPDARGIPVTVDASSTTVLAALGPDGFRAALAAYRRGGRVRQRRGGGGAGHGTTGCRVAPGMLAVVKHGPEPVTLHRPDGTTATVAVPRPRSVHDSTGAGDAFAAGFLVAWAAGAGDEAAALAGHRAAAVLT